MRQEWVKRDPSFLRSLMSNPSLRDAFYCHFAGCAKEATYIQIRYYRSDYDGSEDVDQDCYCDEHTEVMKKRT